MPPPIRRFTITSGQESWGWSSFAGYQLRPPDGETIGVLAIFSKHAVTADEDALLETIACAGAGDPNARTNAHSTKAAKPPPARR